MDNSSGELLVSDRGGTAAKEAESIVPSRCGLYAIFVDDATSLPPPFDSHLIQRQTNLIYIGKGDNLFKRLVQDDLHHKRASTFFRGIGAILGYTPPAGSLLNKSNKNNYRFSPEHTREIVDWADEHLFVKWVTLDADDVRKWESRILLAHCPLLNTQGNPRALPELKAARERCRQIALMSPM